MHMISAEEMGIIDANTDALGIPRKQLMESSGNAIARVGRELVEEGGDIAVVCGRGNNGGDAMVAARFLNQYDVTVYLLGRAENITTSIARENWEALLAAEYDTNEVRDSAAIEFDSPDLIVDGMLGTGGTGALRQPERSAAIAMNEMAAPTLSVDVPSGVDADIGPTDGVAVDADHVVTFHDTKPGVSMLDCKVTVANIGIPAAARRFVGNGDLLRVQRDTTSHKGGNGEVLIIGGGPYTGAPALTGQAALRTGADLVRIACPEGIAREVQGFSENLIVESLPGKQLQPEHVDQLLSMASEQDTVVLGPGLGESNLTLRAVQAFLGAYDGLVVVDADALQVVPDTDTDATVICTPHQGELQAMGGETSEKWNERADLITRFAKSLSQTVLVKGVYDIISDGEQTRISRTGNAAMTVGGTGDVLAGVTAALATSLDPLPAASVAAYVSGRAGDLVMDGSIRGPLRGNGLLATDLVEAIPAAMTPEEIR
jgi:NAD(P)H-hydrate epimerase